MIIATKKVVFPRQKLHESWSIARFSYTELSFTQLNLLSQTGPRRNNERTMDQA